MESRTPVHSDVEVRPWASCAVFWLALREAALELPEHSTNRMRETEGKRFRSSTEYFIGLSTMPWMIETMLGRIDGGNAVVMALEMQARRRDDAHPRLQRREAGRAAGGRQPHHLFGGGTLAIITLGDAARHAPGHVAVIGGKRPHRHDGRRRRQQAAGAKEGATAGGAGPPLREHAVLAFAIRLFVLSRSRT